MTGKADRPVRFSRRLARLAPAACVLLLAASAAPASAEAPGDSGDHRHPTVRGAVAPPRATPGKPLPRVKGSVTVQRGRTLLPPSASRPGTKIKAPTTEAPANVAPSDKAAVAALALTPPKVALRALVVAVDATDWGVATWKPTLDRVGAAYDVLYTRTDPLTAATLVRPDGVGRYNAILLTSSMLLYDAGGGSYVSGLDGTEWNMLWAYERDFGVRQAALYTSYGTWPEDYCLSAVERGRRWATPRCQAALTAGRRGALRLPQDRRADPDRRSPTSTGPGSPPAAPPSRS